MATCLAFGNVWKVFNVLILESFQSFGAGVDIQENGAHQTQELVAQKVKKKLVDKSI